MFMKIYLYILIQLKGDPSFCFQYTFSIKYGITCPFGPFTTFIHYRIISHFQYQNIYKKKLVQKVSNIFHECMVGALLQLRESLTVTPRPDRVYDMCNRRVAYVHQGLF